MKVLKWVKPGMVAQAFNPSTPEQRQAEVSLVYRASSRTAGATQRNPVSKKQEKMRLQGDHICSSDRLLWLMKEEGWKED